MDQRDIIGLWSGDVMYGHGSHSDEWLIFLDNGFGWISEINFSLNSADPFYWKLDGDVLTLTKATEVARRDRQSYVEEDIIVGVSVLEEMTPSGKLMKVITFNGDGIYWYNRYGFCHNNWTMANYYKALNEIQENHKPRTGEALIRLNEQMQFLKENYEDEPEFPQELDNTEKLHSSMLLGFWSNTILEDKGDVDSYYSYYVAITENGFGWMKAYDWNKVKVTAFNWLLSGNVLMLSASSDFSQHNVGINSYFKDGKVIRVTAAIKDITVVTGATITCLSFNKTINTNKKYGLINCGVSMEDFFVAITRANIANALLSTDYECEEDK